MKFLEKYKEEFKEYDLMEKDFIDDDKIWEQLNKWENPSKSDVRKVLEKAAQKVRLEPEEMAILIQNKDKETIEEMYALANKLKKEIYGERIVFFAPLYISNKCANNCKYCGFRRENKEITRRTLTMDEISEEVRIMINEGQKRRAKEKLKESKESGDPKPGRGIAIPPIKKQRNMSIKDINPTNSWQVETKEDIEKYLQDLKERLEKELEENTILNIEF
jgi:biotin synthase-like enzyme